jgi:RNA polymerase sigma-70 factor, ECF subfamily
MMNPETESIEEKLQKDEELACQAQAGSRRCFERLVRRYAIRLFHYLRPRTASDQDAEDLLQETFLRTYSHIGSFDPRYRFSTWIYTIATRLLYSHYRRERPIEIPPDTAATFRGPDEEMLHEEEGRLLWQTARKLPADQYQALWLRYVEDMAPQAIAQIMKKSRLHTHVLLHRARINMNKKMNPAAAATPAGRIPPSKRKTTVFL